MFQNCLIEGTLALRVTKIYRYFVHLHRCLVWEKLHQLDKYCKVSRNNFQIQFWGFQDHHFNVKWYLIRYNISASVYGCIFEWLIYFDAWWDYVTNPLAVHRLPKPCPTLSLQHQHFCRSVSPCNIIKLENWSVNNRLRLVMVITGAAGWIGPRTTWVDWWSFE